jgi:glycerophosphoryl diester phosphodiesterase
MDARCGGLRWNAVSAGSAYGEHGAQGTAPFLIAHRAGNDLERLRAARALGVPLIEADLHLFAGRLEVRHLKTLGPVPILWDRWRVASPRAPRLLLDELLRAVGQAPLMLDLKGRDVRLSELVVAALADRSGGAETVVCSQSWGLLRPLESLAGLRVVHSVGSRRQLAVLRRRFAGRRLAGISIHRTLLDAATARELRERAALLMSWPVESAAQAHELAGWGVQGLITSRYQELAPLFGAGPEVAVAA